jgi:hypothetical protein
VEKQLKEPAAPPAPQALFISLMGNGRVATTPSHIYTNAQILYEQKYVDFSSLYIVHVMFIPVCKFFCGICWKRVYLFSLCSTVLLHCVVSF